MHTNQKAALYKKLNVPELATGAFVLNDRNEALFITGPKFAPQWTVPGGHVDRFETMAACAKRELAEETGLTPSRMVLFKTDEDLRAIMHGRRRHFVFVDFAARVKGRPALTINDEITAWVWLTQAQVRKAKNLRHSAKTAYLNLFALLKAKKIKL